jgi:hypothetical protein
MCENMLIANEKLISKIKKYEGMLAYKQGIRRTHEISPLPAGSSVTPLKEFNSSTAKKNSSRRATSNERKKGSKGSKRSTSGSGNHHHQQ